MSGRCMTNITWRNDDHNDRYWTIRNAVISSCIVFDFATDLHCISPSFTFGKNVV